MAPGNLDAKLDAAPGGVLVAGDAGFPGASDPLFAIAIALGLVALASLAGVITVRREARAASRLARERGQAINELLRTVRLAESIANLGVWQYDPVTADQRWSNGLRRIFGVEHDEEFVAGDAETLLYANDIDLVAHIRRRADERAPFTLKYDIHSYDGAERSISVQACNLFGQDGRVARVIAVVRDVTDEVSRERRLEQSRKAAISEARAARSPALPIAAG